MTRMLVLLCALVFLAVTRLAAAAVVAPTCNQTCLQAALDAGGTVTLTAGDYVLTPRVIRDRRLAGLRITRPHTHLDCEPGATLAMDTRQAAPGDTRALVWIDPVDDVAISGCAFDGLMTATSTFEDWMGVVVEKSNNVVLERLTIENLHGDGVFSFAPARNVTIRNTTIRRAVGQAISGFGYDGLLVDNADIAESIHAAGGAEAMILRGRDIEVRGGRVRDFGVIAGVNVEGLRITGVHVTMNGRAAGGGGIGCGGKDQYCRRARIRDVTVDGSRATQGGYPIRIGGEAMDVKISGGTVIRPPSDLGTGIDVVYDGAPKRQIAIRGTTISGIVPQVAASRLVRASVAVIGPAEHFEELRVEQITNEATTGCISVVGKRAVTVRGNTCLDGGITAVGGEGTTIVGNTIHDLSSRPEPGESGDVSLTVLSATRCDVSRNHVTTGAKAGGILLRHSTDCVVQANRVAVLAPRTHLIEAGISDRNQWLDNLILGSGPAAALVGLGSVIRGAE